MYLAIALALLLALAILSHASKKRMRDAVSNIPGPLNLPLIGAVYKVFDLTPQNFLHRGVEFVAEYGRIIHIWAFNRLVVISGDAELNEQLLASQQHLVKHRNYSMLEQWLGTGLLLSNGRKWFTRRKIITPAFHFEILEQFVEVFDQQASIFVEKLAMKADGKTIFDISPFVCLAALDVIAETAMGTKIYAQSDASTEYVNAVNELTKIISWRFMRVHLINEFIFTLLYPHIKVRIMKLVRILHKFTTKVIEERRRVLKINLEGNSKNEIPTNSLDDDEIFGKKKRMALLDVLLQSTIDGKPLSNEDIREEVDTFMFEGHDTTTSALSFAFFMLSRNKDVQQKLHEEILSVLGKDRNHPITLRDLNELKYTEAVIKETLRMFPSVPLVGRQLLEDFKYTHSKIGDGIIPAGAEFLLSIHAQMNDENLIDKRTAFIPERHFDNENMGAFTFIPFSAGPRNCIGQKFAMLEMKTIIAKTVREYELLPLGDNVIPEINIVLRSTNGWQLGLQKRL